ncbi:YnbE family lipoprotein [Pseudodesulfovibrio cashew]|uniref:YnbE family lipoprotein n=1 Tax=Pseudodesulfovibrio cashew TaxID=2678688 RepID=A0A6I6JD05_9BACT|nr:hypothetical protein [Pseudodesulfovibrio cashew]QGY38958.1 YnbE family lipoprotein [Pseudodesulfovibrio cashew]
MKNLLTAGLCLTLAMLWGCQTSHRVEVAPVEVKPIHITIDVNVKVDKELDDFFSDIDDAGADSAATTEDTNAQ